MKSGKGARLDRIDVEFKKNKAGMVFINLFRILYIIRLNDGKIPRYKEFFVKCCLQMKQV